MDNLLEPTKHEQETLTTAGRKIYSAAIRTGVIGGIVSCLFAMPAIATLFAGCSDSPGYCTGIITLLLLTLAGIATDEVIADYELSPDPARDEILAREHSSVLDAIHSALTGLDIDHYLLTGGASQDDLAALRERLLLS